jgi:monofunctional biosynthetic peptidoglycan transglycosylase
MVRRARHPLAQKPIVARLLKVGKVVAISWLVSVALFRFINPPVTPLILIRSVEYWAKGKSGVKSWEWRPLSYFPLHVQQAIVAAEDSRFMDHWGIDFSAVGTVLESADSKPKLRGASTITMQTVKNIYLWPGRSYLRKALEAVMAPVAGIVWGKRRTLELYLNVIEWGEGVYGLEAASQYYFGRPATTLSTSEAAALAAILPSPRRLHPRNLSRGSERRFDRIVREAQSVAVPTRSPTTRAKPKD